MKSLQFITSVLVTTAMLIILVFEEKNQIVIRWLAAGVGFAALAFQLLLFFTRDSKKKEVDETNTKSTDGI